MPLCCFVIVTFNTLCWIDCRICYILIHLGFRLAITLPFLIIKTTFFYSAKAHPIPNRESVIPISVHPDTNKFQGPDAIRIFEEVTMSQRETSQLSVVSSSTTPSHAPAPSIAHLDRVNYLFGYPIAHSLSPLLHGTIYAALNLNYQQFLYESRFLEGCLSLTQDPKFFGASVTMPHKVTIIPHLDVLTPEGEAIGAVNTIFLRSAPDGTRLLCGTNTDCIGIREAILQNVSSEAAAGMRGKPGMVIGGGGTSRAAVYALKQFLGCSEIYLVNREKSEVDQVIEECTSKGFGDGLKYVASLAEADALPGPKVVVSAVPDFPPRTEDEIRTRKIIELMLGKEEKGTILEMCYHPSPNTAIAAISRKSGWQVIEGVEAMIWQGLEQDKVWLRRKVSSFPIQKVKEVIAAKLAKPCL
jgi:quinate dehydrogenase